MSRNISSPLRMVDLYHEKFEFFQNRKEQQIQLNSTFNVKCIENSNDKNYTKVVIDTCIKDAEGNYKLELSSVGIFELDKNRMTEEEAKEILKVNTVAIMFPYVRSQVSLLTTQPGIQPIIIPPINLNALVEQEDIESE